MTVGSLARGKMTHRAKVERDMAAASGDHGEELSGDWQTHIEALPCWLYVAPGRENVDTRAIVVLESLRMLVPLGTDITELDRINGVTDRLGNVIYAGALNVQSVVPAHTHLEVQLGAVA